jgi:hypothetical protein
MTTRRKWIAVGLVIAFAATICVAQWGGRRGFGEWRDPSTDRFGVPEWQNPTGFEKDVFTFARLKYDSLSYRGRGRGGAGWDTDFRDADLNLSFRLQQLTSLKVDPEGVVVRLTDPELYNYPFIYMVEPGSLYFSEEEVIALRRYLLNGGFLMVDDFWGEDEWDGFYREFGRVFPDRELIELPVEHPIFHCVFPVNVKPQVPGVGRWLQTGRTFEKWDATEVHYRAIFDDKGRMMAIICHNTDFGDGWEEEARNVEYFREFSEKYAYPMAVNIIFYAMTH